MSEDKKRKQVLSYEKARKKRQSAYKRKQIFSIVLIALLIFAALYINDFLVKRNVTSQIGEFVESIGGSGFPIDLPGGTIQNTEALGKNLVVLNDTNLQVFNPKGKRINNIQQMSEHTVLRTNEDRVLVYHQGSSKFSVYSATTELFSKEMDNGIIVADMGQNGDVVIATTGRQFVSEINVYDKDFDWALTISSPQLQVSNVGISPKGKYIAVGYLTTSDGKLQSSTTVYDTSTGEEVQQFAFGEQLTLRLAFLSDASLSVLTDESYMVYSVDGTTEGSYQFPVDSQLKGFESNGKEVVVFYRLSGSLQDEYILLGSTGEPLEPLPAHSHVVDVALSDKFVYVLLPESVERYNFSMELLDSTPVQGVQSIERVKEHVYLLTKSEIQRLEDVAV